MLKAFFWSKDWLVYNSNRLKIEYVENFFLIEGLTTKVYYFTFVSVWVKNNLNMLKAFFWSKDWLENEGLLFYFCLWFGLKMTRIENFFLIEGSIMHTLKTKSFIILFSSLMMQIIFVYDSDIEKFFDRGDRLDYRYLENKAFWAKLFCLRWL